MTTTTNQLDTLILADKIKTSKVNKEYSITKKKKSQKTSHILSSISIIEKTRCANLLQSNIRDNK